jgi:hypothetical protein
MALAGAGGARLVSGGGGGGGGGALTPTKGTPLGPMRASARTPQRSARSPGPSLAAPPTTVDGAAAAPPPDARLVSAFVQPAARLAADAALTALRGAARALRSDPMDEEGAVQLAAEAARAVSDLACAIPHPEVLRPLLDALAPLLAACVDLAGAGAAEREGAQRAEGAGTEQLVDVACSLWCGVLRHWTALPVTDASAPLLQGCVSWTRPRAA